MITLTLNKMLKSGIVCEIGTGSWLGYARVNFDGKDLVSYWLPIPCLSTKGNKRWNPISINTQVYVKMSDETEDGTIINTLYSTKDTPPDWANENTEGIEYKDGTKIYYDNKKHKLLVNLCSGGEIETNAKNQALNAILTVINGASIPELGNGSASALQIALQTALIGINQNIYKV